MRLTGMKEDDHDNSRRFKKCNNTNFSLDSAEIVGLRVQQPPKKQVATKTETELKSATLVTCYVASPEERIEPEYYCLAHMWVKCLRKVTLPLKYGPPHPVKDTDQRGEHRGQILASSNACLTLKIEKSGCTEASHHLQGHGGLSSTLKGSTYMQNSICPLGPPRRYTQDQQRLRAQGVH